jgi:hypothetical protein
VKVSNRNQIPRHILLSVTLIFTFIIPQYVLANASWNGVLKSVKVHPRINIVHVDTNDIATQYYFLATIPMAIFHYGDTVYSSVLIPDDISDPTVRYLLDDWQEYLKWYAGHANFIGDVSSTVQDSILRRFEIADTDFDVINGTPIEVANKIAEKDWQYSDYVVIAPYREELTKHDIESISNASVIASLLNAPLLFAEPDSLNIETRNTISKLQATKIILVEIDDVLSWRINVQLQSMGVTVEKDLETEADIVASDTAKTGRSTLCSIMSNWQALSAALYGARYGGYVLFLPTIIQKLANKLYGQIMDDAELTTPYKLGDPLPAESWTMQDETKVAQDFYNWLADLGGDYPDMLETVITFEPKGTNDGELGVTFERAISGDPSNLSRYGAISGRMPLNWLKNIALVNRTSMYRALIFANPRPFHVILSLNAYEVQHESDVGDIVPDAWGQNHIVNEIFGWPYRGWCDDNNYFPWHDITTNDSILDLSPILPPGEGHGPGHDPGQFASFIGLGYETHFHSGYGPGDSSHPANHGVPNIGFVEDIEDGAVFFYFSGHGSQGGDGIYARAQDCGIVENVPWGAPYWPDTTGRVNSQEDLYAEADLDRDLDNVHGMMVGYNACVMANGSMNEVLLKHGGTISIGSYQSVSFTGSAWWWNIFTYLITHEGYTVGEAAAYANARVGDLYVPSKGGDRTLKYVVFGDPNCPFVQSDWTPLEPALIDFNYGGHKPDKVLYGTLTGVVTDSVSGDSIAGVLIVGYEHEADTAFANPVFEVTTNSLGIYNVEDGIPVGEYDIYVGCEGFFPYSDTITIMHGLNIYNIELKQLTGIAEGIFSGIIPQTHALYQSYPNPFSQSTEIQYWVPDIRYETKDQRPESQKSHVSGLMSKVSLKIYDLSGRVVQTLVNEPQKPGYYRVEWDGRDTGGRKVGTGIYFCTLKVNNFVSTKKLTVIR